MFGITRDEVPKAMFGAIVQLAVLGAIQVGIPLITEPGPFRDIARVGLSGLALFLGFIVLVRWIDRRQGAAVRGPSQPSPSTGSQVFAPSVVQERSNLTLRMGSRRFTRLTNAFSKKLRNHAVAVALHHLHYNFACPHRSLANPYPRTPAMAAGIADHVWTCEEIADLLD